jgi:hypothetical protein
VNSDLATPEIFESPVAPATPKRHVRRAVAVLAVAVFGLGACSSDPGPKRVAEDIIQTAVSEGDLTQAQGDCMFERVEAYTDADLELITASANDPGPGTALDLFEADLAACK